MADGRCLSDRKARIRGERRWIGIHLVNLHSSDHIDFIIDINYDWLKSKNYRKTRIRGERRWIGIHLVNLHSSDLIDFIIDIDYDWLKSNNYILFRLLLQFGLATSSCSSS